MNGRFKRQELDYDGDDVLDKYEDDNANWESCLPSWNKLSIPFQNSMDETRNLEIKGRKCPYKNPVQRKKQGTKKWHGKNCSD